MVLLISFLQDCTTFKEDALAIPGNRIITTKDFITRYKSSRQRTNFPDNLQVRKALFENLWINGVHLLHHIGAYLPVIVNQTKYAKFGAGNNIIIVKVNNDRKRDTPLYGNWISYGGLYRDARLIITDRLLITDANESSIHVLKYHPGDGEIDSAGLCERQKSCQPFPNDTWSSNNTRFKLRTKRTCPC